MNELRSLTPSSSSQTAMGVILPDHGHECERQWITRTLIEQRYTPDSSSYIKHSTSLPQEWKFLLGVKLYVVICSLYRDHDVNQVNEVVEQSYMTPQAGRFPCMCHITAALQTKRSSK